MTQLGWLFLGVLVVVNLTAFLAFGVDKWKARRNSQRVPEQTLALLGLLGGWLGALLAMRVFRHKTQKKSFQAKLTLGVLGNLALWFAAWHFDLLAKIFATAPTG